MEGGREEGEDRGRKAKSLPAPPCLTFSLPPSVLLPSSIPSFSPSPSPSLPAFLPPSLPLSLPPCFSPSLPPSPVSASPSLPRSPLDCLYCLYCLKNHHCSAALATSASTFFKDIRRKSDGFEQVQVSLTLKFLRKCAKPAV